MPWTTLPINIDSAPAPALIPTSNALPGFEFTTHEVNADFARRINASGAINDIDAFLAVFGTDDAAHDGEADRGDTDGGVLDTSALLLGDPPGPGSNPGPGSEPVLPPGLPPPGPGGGVQPAPGPAIQVQPGPAEQLPQTHPDIPAQGSGPSGSSSSQTTVSNTGSASLPDGVNPPGGATQAGGKGAAGSGHSASSSFGNSLGSSIFGAGGSSFGHTAGGLHFGGEGTAFAAGLGLSLAGRSVLTGDTGIRFGDGSGSGAAREPDQRTGDQEMPPPTVDTGMTPDHTPLPAPQQPADPGAAYQRALEQREQAADEMESCEEAINDLQKQIDVIEANVQRAEAMMAPLEARIAADMQTMHANLTTISATRATNERLELRMDEYLAVTEPARLAASQAWDRATEAENSIGNTRAAMSETDDQALIGELGALLTQQENLHQQQEHIFHAQQAIANGMADRIAELLQGVRENEASIIELEAANQAIDQHHFPRQHQINRLTIYIAQGNQLLNEKTIEQIQAQAAWNHARDAWDQANSVIEDAASHNVIPPSAQADDEADTGGDSHSHSHSSSSSSSHGNVSLAVDYARLPPAPIGDTDGLPAQLAPLANSLYPTGHTSSSTDAHPLDSVAIDSVAQQLPAAAQALLEAWQRALYSNFTQEAAPAAAGAGPDLVVIGAPANESLDFTL